MTERVNSQAIDLVWGAKAIGLEINRSPRQTYWLLESGRVPAKKIGDQWVAERGKLRAALVGEAASDTGVA
ncbi:DNA-binding protein [Mesorhizobium sp. M1E.F.Ca.ET.063.01.1.1]|uniref:DNA-binding protein n=1 Tax=Mesorhizobium sp. M1E.F.Ca.ET.063.01.1.1 TaxID=2496750 RepID=UPI001FDEC966|nr:DNA-binding protein [Mesorhizobium sp. M1E.F.Ca.ET.063.01.1.1]